MIRFVLTKHTRRSRLVMSWQNISFTPLCCWSTCARGELNLFWQLMRIVRICKGEEDKLFSLRCTYARRTSRCCFLLARECCVDCQGSSFCFRPTVSRSLLSARTSARRDNDNTSRFLSAGCCDTVDLCLLVSDRSCARAPQDHSSHQCAARDEQNNDVCSSPYRNASLLRVTFCFVGKKERERRTSSSIDSKVYECKVGENGQLDYREAHVC